VRSFWRDHLALLAATFVCAVLLSAAVPAHVARAAPAAQAGPAAPAAPAARADGGSAQFSLRALVASDPAAPAAPAVPYFHYTLQPNAATQGQARVTNTGAARGSVALYAVDATTGQTSGVVYRAAADPRTEVGAWITVGAQQLTLDPGQSQTIAFTVTVPASARPGQHVGGIVAENLQVQQGAGKGAGQNTGSGVQINIQHLSIVAVQVDLPGQQAQRLEATRLQAGGGHGYQTLLLGLRNTGTQMLKPSGTLQVSDSAGRALKQTPLRLDTVLPQTAIDYPVAVTGQALGPGHYRAALSLTYGSPPQTLNRTLPFEITSAEVEQVFGSSAATTPPSSVGVPMGLPAPALIAGVIGALLLLGLGASVVFVPRFRARMPFLRR
jgi:hypothetical protein